MVVSSMGLEPSTTTTHLSEDDIDKTSSLVFEMVMDAGLPLLILSEGRGPLTTTACFSATMPEWGLCDDRSASLVLGCVRFD